LIKSELEKLEELLYKLHDELENDDDKESVNSIIQLTNEIEYKENEMEEQYEIIDDDGTRYEGEEYQMRNMFNCIENNELQSGDYTISFKGQVKLVKIVEIK
jgi:hypothetical protein